MTKNDLTSLKQAKTLLEQVKQANRRNAEAKVLTEIINQIDNMIKYHEAMQR